VSKSATERVEEALAKAHATQGTLNAFISIDDGPAMDRAGEIDDRLARGEEVGPLAGMPVALKDLIDQEGRVTTCGSSFYAETATSTAECVRRLEDAGAVIIGRANLHEFAFGFNSENDHWGTVRNPWDLETSAGGSSGGSGAAVAAGITPIAIGTDTGGSVRVPAALCGTYGLKVTYGKISLDGVFPLVPSVDTVGPLADSIENTAVAYRVMSGDESPEPERRSLRLGIPEPWFGGAPMSDQVAGAFEEAIAGIERLGHSVRPIEMPNTYPSRHIIGALEEVEVVHREFRLQGKYYGKAVEERIISVEELTPDEVAEAREWQRMIRQRFADALGSVDLLITPTTPTMRKVIGEDLIGDQNHRAVLSYFTSIVNHTLHPAIALPLGGTGSPPVSLQVIGDLDSEPLLLGLGRWLEEVEIAAFTTATKNSPNTGGR
jgi:Asp-tRNA(Asn)/Glu-tRNA(Gln) amidotransferase A subunit family amidase